VKVLRVRGLDSKACTCSKCIECSEYSECESVWRKGQAKAEK
jgi:hypothetical protein